MSGPIRILVMGLPGSGKTTLAEQIVLDLKLRCRSVDWFNADEVRKLHDDWDFSIEGRIRQAYRMRNAIDLSDSEFCIVDFIAPLKVMRQIIDADIVVWLDTIKEGRYEDTNALFERPTKVGVDFQFTEKDAESQSKIILAEIFEHCSRR